MNSMNEYQIHRHSSGPVTLLFRLDRLLDVITAGQPVDESLARQIENLLFDPGQVEAASALVEAWELSTPATDEQQFDAIIEAIATKGIMAGNVSGQDLLRILRDPNALVETHMQIWTNASPYWNDRKDSYQAEMTRIGPSVAPPASSVVEADDKSPLGARLDAAEELLQKQREQAAAREKQLVEQLETLNLRVAELVQAYNPQPIPKPGIAKSAWLSVAAAAVVCLTFIGGNMNGAWASANKIEAMEGEIRELHSRIDELSNALEQSGVRTAMIAAISASGRDSIKVEGSWDRRYVDGAELRVGDKTYALEPLGVDDAVHSHFSTTVGTPLDGRDVTAVVEFQPKPESSRRLPEYFGTDKTTRSRRFRASRAGLITDPEVIQVPAEIDQLVNVREHENPDAQRNRYVATGQVFEPVEGMHGWLIIDPVLADNLWVGSRLSMDGSRFVSRCYLGNQDVDGQPYRVFCVFHPDQDALSPGQELPPNFDWTGFVKSPSRYKTNDGDDGFDPEPGRDQ